MKDYSYTDLKDMQERAMERVRSMQQRARETADLANEEINTHTPQRSGESGEPYAQPVQQGAQKKPYHIRMPADIPKRETEFPSFKSYFSAENTGGNHNEVPLSASPGNPALQNKSGILNELMKEPDKAMLFPLLLLLRAEGADEALLMSLLYIMS